MKACDFASRVQGVHQAGDGFTARCPAHDDQRASLSFRDGDRGRLLVKCHAGCSLRAIVDALGLRVAELSGDNGGKRNRSTKPRIVATYPYTDEGGFLLYEVVRYEPKDFKQRRPHSKGGYTWNMDGVRRVLYRLHVIQGQKRVFVTEGERDADTCWDNWIPATCNSGGAGKFTREHAEQLKAAGAENVVMPAHNDKAGQDQAIQVAQHCHVVGIQVKVLHLPGLTPHGDITDWFAAGHTRDELAEILEATPLWEPEPEGEHLEDVWFKPDAPGPESTVKGEAIGAPEQDSGPYLMEGGRICRVKQTKDGPVIEPLCNFTARVTEEVIQDDGLETTRAFVIAGQLDTGKVLPQARVAASRFASMSWVPEHWGLRAVVRAGQTTRDYLREAIQRLSPDALQRRVFTHTGWRQIGTEWVYLTSSGAVGRHGFEVDLGDDLARYRLPRDAEDPAGAMRLSIRLLDIAPLTVTAPLLSGTFRAPLASVLPLDLSLWLEAQTGNLKSTLAALFLCHYGTFDRRNLSTAWASTANQLELRAFRLKDTICVIDEYAPSAMDARELESKASRLIRAQGNLAGRGRLRSDLTERPAFPPRGLIVATGEQHPPGQSVLARMLIVEPRRQEIDLAALTEAQRQADRLPHAMAGYVAWLAPQMSTISGMLRETFEGARARVLAGAPHLRVPEVLAHLWVGLHCGLAYAEDIGSCTGGEAESLRARGWDALVSLGAAQGRLVEDERPSRRFLRVLLTLVTQGRALLLPRDENNDGGRPGADLIGWQDDEGIYLIPEASHQAVSRFCREAGEPFPVRRERLQKDLALDGLAQCDPGRYTKVERVGGSPRRVLSLKRQAVADLVGEAFPLPLVTGVTGFAE